MFDDRYSLAHKIYPYQKAPDQEKAAAVRHPELLAQPGPPATSKKSSKTCLWSRALKQGAAARPQG